MKKFFSLILVCSLVQSVFGLEYGYQEALFNADDYFQKDHFVVNNFYPEMKLTDFWDIYRRNVPVREEDLSNIIHLEMDDADWKSFMSHYLSKHRFVGRQWYDFSAFIRHDGKTEEVSGRIKHRGNYSSKSLKVGFRFKLDEDIEHGVFAGKKKIIFRHLMFDRTGTNEYVYFKGYKDLHKATLGYDAMMVDLDYYWVFINDRPYGYYLVMNDSKKEILESRGGEKFDEERDCIVKAKTWKSDISANMEYREGYEDFSVFNDIYRIEEGDEQRCYEEILQLMKDVRDENFDLLGAKIADWDQFAFYAHYQDITENKAGVFQNYLMIKHKGKWEISPWDGDLTFLMDARISARTVAENALFKLAYKASNLDFDEPTSRMYLGTLLKEAFGTFSTHVHLDRKIWSAYIPKQEKYIPQDYYKYSTGEYGSKEVYRYISNLFRTTYRYFVIRS